MLMLAPALYQRASNQYYPKNSHVVQHPPRSSPVTSSVVPLSFSAKMEGTDDVSEAGLQLDVFQQALPNDEYLNP